MSRRYTNAEVDDWFTAFAAAVLTPDYVTDWAAGPEAAVERAEIEHLVRRTMQQLPPKRLVTICLRFGFDGGETKTLAEAGALLGVGRERVRQIQNGALRYMRWVLVRESTTFERAVLGVDLL